MNTEFSKEHLHTLPKEYQNIVFMEELGQVCFILHSFLLMLGRFGLVLIVLKIRRYARQV